MEELIAWRKGSVGMDMISIPEDAEVTPTTVKLPHETYQPCRHGRNILVAVDHGQDSRRAFEWAITNLVRVADTLHLVHVLPTNCKCLCIILFQRSKDLFKFSIKIEVDCLLLSTFLCIPAANYCREQRL